MFQAEQMIGLNVNIRKRMQNVGANAFLVSLADLVCQSAHVSRGKLTHQLWADPLHLSELVETSGFSLAL